MRQAVQSTLTAKNPSRRCSLRRDKRGKKRRGATLVEMALVLPIFFILVFGLFEFGHALMVLNYLTSIAKQAAHQGSFEDVSTAEVQQFANSRLDAILGSGACTTYIRDASLYEGSNPGSVSTASLPTVELSNLESRDLFIVQVEVPYESVALISPFWIKNTTLTGVSIMRRE